MTWTVYVVVSHKGSDIGNKGILGRCLFHDAAMLISNDSKCFVVASADLVYLVFRISSGLELMIRDNHKLF